MPEPQYTKRISNQLAVSLSYTASADPDKVECLITFKNILHHHVVVNPGAKQDQNGGGNWLASIFGDRRTADSETETENLSSAVKEDTQPLSIFLGYMQLFGYVVCNYKFDLNDANAIGNLGGNDTGVGVDEGDAGSGEYDDDYVDASVEGSGDLQLWSNKDYTHQYNNDNLDDDIKHEGWSEDLDIDEILDSAPFIEQSYQDRMVIGGKIGGIDDLVVVDDDKRKAQYQQQHSKQSDGKFQIDRYKRSLLQDLVARFNTYPEPTGYGGTGADGIELIKEISDSILPFLATSQSLLFSNVNLKRDETKVFRVLFPKLKNFPPSYNTKLTGMTGDQGLLSIRYQLAVGLLEMNSRVGALQSKTVYFPYEVKAEYIGNSESYLLPDFLRRTIIDQSWQVSKIEDDGEKVLDKKEQEEREGVKETEVTANGTTDETELLNKKSFLEDLTKLIDSDLHNMPLISSTERRKSIHTIDEHVKDGLNLQLPKHLKTQYQIRLNNQELCMVSIKKPYYHVGEDLSFVIDTENAIQNNTKIVGITAHIEAHEIFHCKNGKNKIDKDYTNIYKVSPYLKINSFASSMTQVVDRTTSSCTTIQGSINIASHLATQFQCSRLFDLLYFLAFKFNLNEFEEEENIKLNTDGAPANDASNQEETLLEPSQSSVPANSLPRDRNDFQFTKFRRHQLDNNGSEFKFKLPIILI